MPDIRIEIPSQIKDGSFGPSIATVPSDIASLATAFANDAAGKEMGLAITDFWGRASFTESNVNVLFVDITLVKGEKRTPAVRKRLATGVRKNFKKMLDDNGYTKWGVLVWIHVKDDDDFSEVEPS